MKFILKLLPLLLILVGCASFYDATPEKQVVIYKKPVAIESGFNISGRFIIKQPNKNNYGNFTWNKTNESEILDFNSPIGQTVAEIIIESGIATLYTRNESYTAESFNEVMQKQLGFVLPISYLHYWIQGTPLPNESIDAQLTDGFVQLGWNIEYLQWIDTTHPEIVQCTKDDLVIKLLIQW
jgi:outer membrane lipoprotein LolB